jgi:hypothetical protein
MLIFKGGMKMRKLLGYMLMAGIALSFAGCKMTDVQSKDECLDDFFSKAQAGSWTTMYEEIHPDNSNRSNYKSGTTFSTIYNTSVTWSVTSRNGDSFTVNVNPKGAGSNSETFTFRSQSSDSLFEGDTWLIYHFTNASSTY